MANSHPVPIDSSLSRSCLTREPCLTKLTSTQHIFPRGNIHSQAKRKNLDEYMQQCHWWFDPSVMAPLHHSYGIQELESDPTAFLRIPSVLVPSWWNSIIEGSRTLSILSRSLKDHSQLVKVRAASRLLYAMTEPRLEKWGWWLKEPQSPSG